MTRVLFLLFATVSLSFASDLGFLIRFHRALLDNLPTAFEAQLRSPSIERKLATLPSDMVAPGQRATVTIRYQKNRGMRLQVTGLTEEGQQIYGDIFQPYARIFTLGPLLLSPPTESTWEGYTVKTVAGDERNAVISLTPDKTANEFVLYIDRSNLRLHRLDFKGSGFSSSTIIRFAQRGAHWIPDLFIAKTFTEANPDPLPERFQLVNIRVTR